jgi:hypothetical protein
MEISFVTGKISMHIILQWNISIIYWSNKLHVEGHSYKNWYD